MRRLPWPVVASIVLASAISLHRLGDQSIWFDEGWSAFAAARPTLWGAITADPTNPPLHYALLHLWVRVAGDDPFTLRWLSAAFGVVTVPLAYRLARRLAGARAGRVAALLVAVSPLVGWAAREARMYTLLAALSLAAALAWHRLREGGRAAAGAGDHGRSVRPAGPVRRRAWLVLWLAEISLLYAHNTGPVAALWLNAVTIVAWVVDRAGGRPGRRLAWGMWWRTWWIGQFAVAALWAPWLFARFVDLPGANRAVAATSALDWDLAWRIWQAPWTGPWFMAGREPALAALSAAILAVVVLARPWRQPGARWALLHAGVLLAALLAGLRALGNELHGRYLVMLAPLWLVAVAIGVAGARRRLWRTLACAVFVVDGLAAAHLMTDRPGYGHDDARAMVEYYADALGDGDTVLAWSYADRFDLAYYWDRLDAEARRVTLPEGADLEAVVPLLPARGDVALNVWFAQRADYRGMLGCVLEHGARRPPETFTVHGMTSLLFRDLALDVPRMGPAGGAFEVARVTALGRSLGEPGGGPGGEGEVANLAVDQALCLPVEIELARPVPADLQAALIARDAPGREVAHADAVFAQADQRTATQVAPGARLAAFPLVRLPAGAPAGAYTLWLRVYDATQMSGYDVVGGGKELLLGVWAVR